MNATATVSRIRNQDYDLQMKGKLFVLKAAGPAK